MIRPIVSASGADAKTKTDADAGRPHGNVPGMTTLYVGVDTGTSGALAAVMGGALIGIWDMPVVRVKTSGRTRGGKRRTQGSIDAAALLVILDSLTEIADDAGADRVAVVERPATRRGEAAHTAFQQGKNYGLLVGLVVGRGFRCARPWAGTWKRNVLGPGEHDKRDSADLAAEIWGRARFFGPRGGVLDGRAEAALLARYGADHVV